MSKILVVAAHPDDELLGIGGIVKKHAKKGDTVRSIIMCEGESLRYGKNVGQSIATSEAARVLGVEKVYTLGFPDQKLDTFTLTDLITPLENISEEFKPDIIYCQSACDANRDHKILFEAATLIGRYGESEYGKSKLAGEELFFEYGKETGAKVAVYRFPNLMGHSRPNYNSAVSTFCNAVANDLPFTVNDRSTKLELLYIDDLIEGMFDLLECRNEKVFS